MNNQGSRWYTSNGSITGTVYWNKRTSSNTWTGNVTWTTATEPVILKKQKEKGYNLFTALTLTKD